MKDKELKIYKYIIAYMEQNGYAPSYREIADCVGMAVSCVLGYLEQLEKGGWIRIKPRTPRAIQVVGYKFVKVS